MDLIHAHITAGATAADARLRMQTGVRCGLGDGWSTANPGRAMAVTTTNEFQPRRLGQRST